MTCSPPATRPVAARVRVGAAPGRRWRRTMPHAARKAETPPSAATATPPFSTVRRVTVGGRRVQPYGEPPPCPVPRRIGGPGPRSGLLPAGSGMSRDSRAFERPILCESVDFAVRRRAKIDARQAGPARGRPTRPGRHRSAVDARPPAPGAHPRPGPRRTGRSASPTSPASSRVSDMTVRRDLEILHEQGLLEKVHGGATALSRLAPVRARLRRQVDAPAGRRRRRSPRRPRSCRARHGDRHLGRHDDLCAGRAAVAEIPGVTVVTNSMRRRGGAPPHRAARPDGDPDRRHADAVRGAGRPVRRRPAPHGPPRPGVHGRPRHGRQGRASPAPTCSRPRPTAR